jgi:hypothetical protein
MIKQEHTLPILEVLEPENISEKINELISLYEAIEGTPLDAFK